MATINTKLSGGTLGRVRKFMGKNRQGVLFVALFASLGVIMLATSRAATGNDLIVTSVTMTPAAPAAGQAVTFSAVVKNQGTTAVPAGTLVGVGFTVDGTRVTWSETNTAGLAAGASVTLTASAGTTGATWLATAGPHTVVATADDTNAIPDEDDKGNNTKTVNFSIGNTGRVYVTPTTASVLVNNNVTVAVRLTPGIAVDSATATLTFDSTKLQFVGADTTGTLFTNVLSGPAAGTTTVTVALGDLNTGTGPAPTTSADTVLMNVTFKALAGSGSTALTVAGNATKPGTGAYTNPASTPATINFTAPDTTAPATSITSPLANANLVSNVTIGTAASDAVGVTKVELYVDGVLRGTDTATPYSFNLNSTTYSNGLHNFQTKAYDAAGNVGSSTVVALNVKNWAEDINQDGSVDIADFSLLAGKFNQTGATIGRSDINGDGVVDIADFSLLAGKFNQ